MRTFLLICVLAMSFTAGVVYGGQDEDPDSIAADTTASRLDMEVREILGHNCATSICHAGKRPKMDLSLEADDIPANMIDVPSRQDSDLMLIDTGDPSRSYLLLKITGGEGMKGRKMPIMKDSLDEKEIRAITEWVEQFAVRKETGESEEEDGDS
jgi:hypothetical protein